MCPFLPNAAEKKAGNKLFLEGELTAKDFVSNQTVLENCWKYPCRVAL